MLSQGQQFTNTDNWSTKGGSTQLRTDLITLLAAHKGQNVLYGLAAPHHEGPYLGNLLKMMKATCQQLTYANLWVNANYPRTKRLWLDLVHNRSKDVVLIVGQPVMLHLNKTMPSKQFASVMTVPLYGVDQWETQRDQCLQQAVHLAQRHQRKVFLLSAGPLAKVLVSAMWNASQNNQYIDVGSSFDEVGKGTTSRGYMDPSSSNARQVDPCWGVNAQGTPRVTPCIA